MLLTTNRLLNVISLVELVDIAHFKKNRTSFELMKLLLVLLAVIVLAKGNLPTCDICQKWIDYMRTHVVTEDNLDQMLEEFCTANTPSHLQYSYQVLLKSETPAIREAMEETLDAHEVCTAVNMCWGDEPY
ncbi:unnamed protein product [Cylicocyclus nassatus]|uniref:Saposin B-type domain-containing protein n=1 Tax=Cylicocyclus nassatus TaxID=53992 RepID=A0AA36GIE3_CYLNA|nr:unnamed protein product [Cylicocyclus nassatus]